MRRQVEDNAKAHPSRQVSRLIVVRVAQECWAEFPRGGGQVLINVLVSFSEFSRYVLQSHHIEPISRPIGMIVPAGGVGGESFTATRCDWSSAPGRQGQKWLENARTAFDLQLHCGTPCPCS